MKTKAKKIHQKRAQDHHSTKAKKIAKARQAK